MHEIDSSPSWWVSEFNSSSLSSSILKFKINSISKHKHKIIIENYEIASITSWFLFPEAFCYIVVLHILANYDIWMN